MSSEMTTRWAGREAEEDAAKELGYPSAGCWALESVRPDRHPSQNPTLSPIWHEEEIGSGSGGVLGRSPNGASFCLVLRGSSQPPASIPGIVAL